MDYIVKENYHILLHLVKDLRFIASILKTWSYKILEVFGASFLTLEKLKNVMGGLAKNLDPVSPEYIIGLTYIVLVGIVISWTIQKMWEAIGLNESNEEKLRPNPWLPALVGIIERFIFFISFLHFHEKFFDIVGYWFLIKVAAGWKRWQEGEKLSRKARISGYDVYKVFLIGSTLSTMHGMVGAMIVNWTKCSKFGYAIIIPIISIYVTFFMGFIAAMYRDKTIKKKKNKVK